MHTCSLYTLTRDLHHAAEEHPFAKKMLAGSVSWQEWTDWCAALRLVHEVIDQYAHASLRRGPELEADLCNLLPLSPRTLPSAVHYARELRESSDVTGAVYIWCAAHLRGGAVIRKRLEPHGLPCAHLRYDDARTANDQIVALRGRCEAVEGSRRAFRAVIDTMTDIEELS